MRRSLLALIAAEVISSFGSLMTLVALPWFVLETTGSPEKMGVVLAAEAAPLVLFAIPSGRLAGGSALAGPSCSAMHSGFRSWPPSRSCTSRVRSRSRL